MDNSEYENAKIIHDLNEQILKTLEDKYDFVFNGWTVEYVFNLPQMFKNIYSTLKVWGIVVYASSSINFLDHGYYTFSPQLLYDFIKKIIMK